MTRTQGNPTRDWEHLKPNQKVLVYHGTREKHAMRLINGFDANTLTKRDYQPSGYRHAGLFVTPSLAVARGFSSGVVLEIETRAKHLHGTDYAGTIRRHHKAARGERLRDYAKKAYPHSFRPGLTDTLRQSGEPQALLRGLVNANQIKRVQYKGKWMSRKAFIRLAPDSGDRYTRDRWVDAGVSMSYPKRSLDEFITIMAHTLGEKDFAYIKKTLLSRAKYPPGTHGYDTTMDLMHTAGFGETARKAFMRKLRRAAAAQSPLENPRMTRKEKRAKLKRKLKRAGYGASALEGKSILQLEAMEDRAAGAKHRGRKKSYRDRIPGGKADKMRPCDFPARALKRGTDHEMEHTSSRKLAREIAMDHLMEDMRYYTKLERMEYGNPRRSEKSLYLHGPSQNELVRRGWYQPAHAARSSSVRMRHYANGAYGRLEKRGVSYYAWTVRLDNKVIASGDADSQGWAKDAADEAAAKVKSNPSRRSAYEDKLTLRAACPHCRAAKGKPCRTARGKAAKIHVARHRKAEWEEWHAQRRHRRRQTKNPAHRHNPRKKVKKLTWKKVSDEIWGDVYWVAHLGTKQFTALPEGKKHALYLDTKGRGGTTLLGRYPSAAAAKSAAMSQRAQSASVKETYKAVAHNPAHRHDRWKRRKGTKTKKRLRGGPKTAFVQGPKGGRTNIQSILFDKKKYTPTTARAWLKSHGYKSSNRLMDVSRTGGYIHVRQQDPKQFKGRGGGIRTITFGKGIKARVGIQ